MKTSPIGLLSLLFAATLGISAPAWARPANTPPGQQPSSPSVCAVSDVSIGGVAATSCLYYPPNQNDSESLLNSTPFAGISTWDLQWKTDSGDQGAAGALQLSLSDLVLSAGTVDLNWTGGPMTADIALIVKAASEFHAYFFDDLTFGSPTGSFDSTYLVQIFNNNNIRQGLSHLSLYSASVTPIVTSGCPVTTPGCGVTTQVPAPAPIALIGLGLFGLAAGARRGKRAA